MGKPAFRAQRRAMLRTTGAIGLAAALPPWLSSCGGDGGTSASGATGPLGAAPVAAARETRHLHFDLSDAPVSGATLFALRSAHHGAPLQPHTDESRIRHRALNPALADVPDGKLTHYLEDADLPAGALQTVMAVGTDPATGRPVLAGVRVHAPRAALDAVAKRAADRGTQGLPSVKRLYYGLPATRATQPGDDINAFSSPLDVATFLVFHHPEVMNLKPDLGAEILARIEALPCSAAAAGAAGSCTPFIGALASRVAVLIAQKGYPTTTPGSWATLVPQTNLDGAPVRHADGSPVYGWDIEDSVVAATGAVVRQILKDIFNDPLFQGSNWQATVGIASKTAAPRLAAAAGGSAETFSVEAAHPVGSTISGIEMTALEVVNAGSRQVRLTVRNRYLRFLSVYVRYEDAAGNPLPVDNPGELDSSRARYLQMVPTNDQIMGIPFQGDNVGTTDIVFTLPANAAKAVVMFGSLGLGGDAFTREAVAGTCLTLALNIGIPAILLAAGAYADFKEPFYAILNNQATLRQILRGFFGAFLKAGPDLGAGIYSSAESQSAQAAIVGLGNIAVQNLLSQAPTLLLELTTVIGAAQMLTAIPFVNVACKVLAVVADLAAIAVSVGESLSCPAITTNSVSLTMASTVRILRDPRDFQFPASARRYVVEATYDGGAVPRKAEGTLAQGRADPIEVALGGADGVPSGGKVIVKVSLYSDAGCLVGVKQSDPIANLPDTAGVIPVQIVELNAPLDADTRYQHSRKLAYADGKRAWTASPAPQFTRGNLCQGGAGGICGLNGLTVHTASGMAGYGFDAGDSQVAACGGGTGNLNLIQNVFLGDNPDGGLKRGSCGFTQPVGIVYDPQGPAVGGHHFFLQPLGNVFHLRSVTLDAATPFDLNQTKSWGRFTSALDALAVLTSGYVVGVNRTTHKMESLTLPSQAVDQANAPNSVPFASMTAGLGTRAGLLDTPVAVAGFQGAVLVLEQGNKRIQALDPSANPVKLFKGGTTNIAPLVADTGAIYLDLAVEGAGYMYVLSYISDGLALENYRLDLYTPNGDFLARTAGVAAGRLAVDLFRNVYTLNYEPLVGAPRVEPSLSQWLPLTPNVCPSSLPASASASTTALACGPSVLA